METILGLLLILLPVIFKFIGKKFEQSGNPEAAEKMRKVLESMGEENESPIAEWLRGDEAEKPEAENVKVPTYMPPVVEENVVRQTAAPKPLPVKTASKKPILVEDEPKKKREKIDPKKLVIYSEIMKPKYTE